MKTASQIVLVLCLSAFGVCVQSAPVDKIVAVVGDQVITSNELNQAYSNDLAALPPAAPKLAKKDYLDHMIEKMLIEQEVKRQGVSVTAQEIEQALNKKRDQLGLTPAEFSQALRDQGITMEAYRDQVRQSLSMAKVVSKEVKASSEISDQEITSYYQKHPDQFQTGDKVHLFHIVVRDSENSAKTIKAIQQQFQKGTSFQRLGRKIFRGRRSQERRRPGLGGIEPAQARGSQNS